MSNQPKPSRVGVSTWALHQLLGAPPIFGPESGNLIPAHICGSALSLLQSPSEMRRNGFDTLQICHFHLPSRDEAYLRELGAEIKNAGVRLHALLVDAGDITHSKHGERDAKWISEWLPVAASLGAEETRIIAGQTVTEGALAESATVLNALAQQGNELGVAISTENWFDLLSGPAQVQELMDLCNGQVRFLFDFGNWGGPEKHENLKAIAPLASSNHAQAAFLESGELDAHDYDAILKLLHDVGFDGVYTLVNSSPREEVWKGLNDLKNYIVQHNKLSGEIISKTP